VSPPDTYDPNETEDMAYNFGGLTPGTSVSTFPVTIDFTPAGVPDYDWFRFAAASPGRAVAILSTAAGGPLELHLYRKDGNQLAPIASGTPVAGGALVYAEVKTVDLGGGHRTSGTYVLTLSLGQ
jgi:hypothetical protein